MKYTCPSALALCLFASVAQAGPLYPQLAQPGVAMPAAPAMVYTQPAPPTVRVVDGYENPYTQASPRAVQSQTYNAPAAYSAPAYEPNEVVISEYVSPPSAPSAPPEASTSASEKEKDKVWFGSVEAGIMYSTGNTERRNANAKGEVGYRPSEWEHRLSADLVNTEENDVQTDEEYRVNGQTRYNFTDRDYGFGELNYIKDRFSGYDYRIKEILGYGRKWVDTDELAWSSEVGAGFQQTKELNGDSENDPLATIRNDIDWQINDYIAFLNATEVDISSLTTVRNEAALKNKISDSLYVKLGVDVEYLSDVPAGTNDTDTDVYMNLAYEY